jgi:TctA family transporter
MFDIVVMFVFGAVSIEVWDTEFPIWAFVLALTIGVSLPSPYLTSQTR